MSTFDSRSSLCELSRREEGGLWEKDPSTSSSDVEQRRTGFLSVPTLTLSQFFLVLHRCVSLLRRVDRPPEEIPFRGEGLTVVGEGFATKKSRKLLF